MTCGCKKKQESLLASAAWMRSHTRPPHPGPPPARSLWGSLFGFGIGGASHQPEPETSEFAGVFGTCAWGRAHVSEGMRGEGVRGENMASGVECFL